MEAIAASLSAVLRVDQAVGAEVLRLLKPLGVEAALDAIAAKTVEVAEKRRQIELALKQARYEAARAAPIRCRRS